MADFGDGVGSGTGADKDGTDNGADGMGGTGVAEGIGDIDLGASTSISEAGLDFDDRRGFQMLIPLNNGIY